MGEENESVRGRRDPSGLFAVEIVCVCSVFDVGNKAFFRLQRGYEHRIYESWRMRASKRLPGGFQEVEAGQQEEPDILDGWIPSHRGLHHALELGRTPTQSEVFARTHTQKEDREWVDKRSSDVNDAYEAELKRLQDERRTAIDAEDLVPPQSTRPRCGHE
ncbi:hypothetical protein PIB30_027768 [Stylosanthes scabra]|uniref:Uncharacterized protein n=1 Tax=Stylosanthes scabra TaxID=79078 RepID=A0ABU6ZAK4_9FABA|nr:hypothetical protein [Stylosanthes scabra]